MTKTEFEKWLTSNNWWSSTHYYFFTDKQIFIEGNKDFNDAEIKAYFKRHRTKRKLDEGMIYKIEESNGDLIMHVDGIKGVVEIHEHRFRLHQESGDVFELSQWSRFP
jgi:hypothetical protein